MNGQDEPKFSVKGPVTPFEWSKDSIALLQWLNQWQAAFLAKGWNPYLLDHITRRVQYDFRMATRDVNAVKFVKASELDAMRDIPVREEEDDRESKKARTE